MKPRKAAVVFIFVTVTLDTLALGLIAPVRAANSRILILAIRF